MTAVYVPEGDAFVPTEHARGPWSPTAQHGGPPTGLLARAILGSEAARDLRLARITVDLFRVVPMAPVSTRVEVLRRGRRVALVRADLIAEGAVVAVAHGSLLAPSDTPPREHPHALPGPEGLDTSRLLPDAVYEAIGFGFHSFVEVRWAKREDPGATAWFRVPGPLVEGEETAAFVRAAALSDYVNALCSLGSVRQAAAFINTDTSVHFAREPEGEWLGLEVTGAADTDGVGFGEVLLHDVRGCIGRAVQARLANTTAWRA